MGVDAHILKTFETVDVDEFTAKSKCNLRLTSSGQQTLKEVDNAEIGLPWMEMVVHIIPGKHVVFEHWLSMQFWHWSAPAATGRKIFNECYSMC